MKYDLPSTSRDVEPFAVILKGRSVSDERLPDAVAVGDPAPARAGDGARVAVELNRACEQLASLDLDDAVVRRRVGDPVREAWRQAADVDCPGSRRRGVVVVDHELVVRERPIGRLP